MGCTVGEFVGFITLGNAVGNTVRTFVENYEGEIDGGTLLNTIRALLGP